MKFPLGPQHLVQHVVHEHFPLKQCCFNNDGAALDPRSIWNLTTGQCTKELTSHTEVVRDVAFTFDGSSVVSGSWDKTVR